MKALLPITFISILFFGMTLSAKAANATSGNNTLVIIEQDFAKARSIAAEEDKLLFIDFYTTWCAPCKKLDKLIFQNDSIQQILGQNFILLKYDAEQDTAFHLSKKHHVLSYPTAIVLNQDGYVVNRKYGFPGEDFEGLSNSVVAFTEESMELNQENKYLLGYANTIAPELYPTFYNDFVNRSIKKVPPAELASFFDTRESFLKEEDFTPLFYFARKAPASVGDILLRDKQAYFDRYGKQDVEVLFYFIASKKFDEAIAANDDSKYDKAVAFTKQALSQGWIDDLLPSFEIDRLKAQNNWGAVLQIYADRKQKGDLSDGELNFICWDIYKHCDDQQAISKSLEWMKALTEETPSYAYLDTYAYLLYKAGNLKAAEKVGQRALEAAEEEGVAAKALQELLEKLSKD